MISVRGMARAGVVMALVLLLSSTVAEQTRGAVQYTITDLGSLSGPRETRPLSINATGQVVGFSGDHAFLWQKGGLTDLGAGQAVGINNNGEVVGGFQDSSGNFHAFLWKNGAKTDLGNLGYPAAWAEGINDAGQVAGFSITAAPENYAYAFIWQNGVMTSLGTLHGAFASNGYGINGSGHVVGSAAWKDGTTHAFLWRDGAMTDLGTLSGVTKSFSRALAINDLDQVVGFSDAAGSRRAFLWEKGVMTDLGALGGANSGSWAHGVNNLGQVVGMSELASRQVAFLYEQGHMFDLNAQLAPGSGGPLLWLANAINDAGQIVAEGTFNGENHAYLLTPVPEPATLALLALGGAALLARRKKN